MTPGLGASALFYAAELGWPVLPLWPDKRPRPAHGFLDASSHPEQVAAWWQRWPDAGIGFHPGPARILVIDVDSAEGAATCARLGFDGPTLTVRTGRDGGGEHRYYRIPEGLSIGNLAWPGLDVRSAGGYAVVPPTVHPSGRRYAWSSGDWPNFDAIADAPPDALAQLLAPPASASPSIVARAPVASFDSRALWRAARYLAKVPHGIGGGEGRHPVAFNLCRALVHTFALPLSEARAIADAWNAANAPPIPDRELARTLRDAASPKYAGGAS